MKRIIAYCVLVIIIGGGVCLGLSISPEKVLMLFCVFLIAAIITWALAVLTFDK